MKAKTVKEVLIAAKWILENVGWCQKAYVTTKDDKLGFDPDGSAAIGDVKAACALGSIYMVQSDNHDLRPGAVDVLQNEVINITNWNDDPARTKQEVLDMFTRAIEKAS